MTINRNSAQGKELCNQFRSWMYFRPEPTQFVDAGIQSEFHFKLSIHSYFADIDHKNESASASYCNQHTLWNNQCTYFLR